MVITHSAPMVAVVHPVVVVVHSAQRVVAVAHSADESEDNQGTTQIRMRVLHGLRHVRQCKGRRGEETRSGRERRWRVEGRLVSWVLCVR